MQIFKGYVIFLVQIIEFYIEDRATCSGPKLQVRKSSNNGNSVEEQQQISNGIGMLQIRIIISSRQNLRSPAVHCGHQILDKSSTFDDIIMNSNCW